MIETALLRTTLATPSPGSTIVATLPWQWPAVGAKHDCRRVLDIGDDWGTLLPQYAKAIRVLCARAAEEADEIVVVSTRLQELFPDREVRVVRNGLDDSQLEAPISAPPRARKLAYVGTLSERFDAPLVSALLDRLPGWSLELYGSCAYPGRGDQPDDELRALLRRADGRARWHGPIDRGAVPASLDAADVLLVPHRSNGRGQDSLKIYDYAARGRPVVATTSAIDGTSQLSPHLYSSRDSAGLAANVAAAEHEPGNWHEERQQWARTQRWDARWPAWSAALFGPATPGS